MKLLKIDLHGLRYDEASSALIRFIEANWGSGAEIEIITGNSQRMQGVAFRVLEEYKLTYQISRLYDTNPGYLVSWL